MNNSIVLHAYLYTHDNQVLIPMADISSVKFTVLKPGDDPNSPTINDANGTIVADGTGRFTVPSAVNDVEGEYRAFAKFTYTEDGIPNLVKSIPIFYDVIDVFERTGPTPADKAIDMCWTMLEDCFDSEFGGPWLRDMTMRVFDKTKVKQFVPTVLLQINQQMPFTEYTEESFPWQDQSAEALFAHGLLVATIRHLIRAYTEQPDVLGSPVAYMDRKRYADAWRATYAEEEKLFERWLNRWKLRSYDITTGKLLVGTKAGRLLPAPMRSRNVGRGF
ncbi:MAG: hypothetical protein QXY15_11190 [Candidatus Nitrosotenuis sp.]